MGPNIQNVRAHTQSTFIHTAYTAFDVLRLLNQSGQKERTAVFVDVDDTLITPQSTTFRKPPFNRMIDEIKANKIMYHNYEHIISTWRLNRKVMLVDDAWPDVLTNLKQHYEVYALTQMDTGAFGTISSMEGWRFQELNRLGLTFSDDTSHILSSHRSASFYKGIFMTGPNTKAETLAIFKDQLQDVQTVIMIDDRDAHLNDIAEFCKLTKRTFMGIHFRGVEALTGEPDPTHARMQKEYLIERLHWLEDDGV